MSPSEKIILALDIPDVERAQFLVSETKGIVGYYKVGLSFLPLGGLSFSRELVNQGHKVFLDLKLFDIYQTVYDTVFRLSDLGISILTVHGDPRVVEAAVAARAKSGTENHLQIYGVTVLTSLDENDLPGMGFENISLPDLVLRRAGRVRDAGGTGVIASAHEVASLKSLYPSLKVITPGIRLHTGQTHDQKRVMTPQEAVNQGSDHLVIGRQITHSDTPRLMAQEILESLSS